MSKSKKLGEIIRTNRIDHGLTQIGLAEKARTSGTSVSRIEKDAMDASYSTLKKIVETGLGGELTLAIKL